jgi:hypothetical protein
MLEPVATAIKHFTEHELACKGSGIIKLDPRFADELVKIREAWGLPLVPSSVCRSPEHNKKEGGHPRSLHLTDNPKWPTFGTMAIDIIWDGWAKGKQQEFAQLARKMGWRVGLANSFIHLDRGHDVGVKPGVYTYKGYMGGLDGVIR